MSAVSSASVQRNNRKKVSIVVRHQPSSPSSVCHACVLLSAFVELWNWDRLKISSACFVFIFLYFPNVRAHISLYGAKTKEKKIAHVSNGNRIVFFSPLLCFHLIRTQFAFSLFAIVGVDGASVCAIPLSAFDVWTDVSVAQTCHFSAWKLQTTLCWHIIHTENGSVHHTRYDDTYILCWDFSTKKNPHQNECVPEPVQWTIPALRNTQHTHTLPFITWIFRLSEPISTQLWKRTHIGHVRDTQVDSSLVRK